jgi:F-type H+-transporting ATPase subunit delta
VSGMNVARRYAKALIELGVEAGNLDALVREFSAIAETVASSAELRAVIVSPNVPRGSRKAVLADIATRLELGTTVKNALSLLADNKRLRLIPAIAEALKQGADQRGGVLRAKVTSAAPLTEMYVAKLTAALEARFHKTIVVERSVDPTLLSGVVTRVGDTVIDGSLKSRLDQLHAALLPN